MIPYRDDSVGVIIHVGLRPDNFRGQGVYLGIPGRVGITVSYGEGKLNIRSKGAGHDFVGKNCIQKLPAKGKRKGFSDRQSLTVR